MEAVILVDSNDKFIATMEKMAAHEQGKLHRAFSIYLFNSKNELLLQRRAAHKYHSAGLWTNTCCSHPRPKETNDAAAKRRLMEEMGIIVPLKHLYHFIYKAEFDNGLIEHELDHVFIGQFDGEPEVNKDEVMEWKYIPPKELLMDILAHPENYTAWFKISVEDVLSKALSI